MHWRSDAGRRCISCDDHAARLPVLGRDVADRDALAFCLTPSERLQAAVSVVSA